MEALDWIILVGVILLLFYAKFHFPTQYQAVMGAVDKVAKSAMSFIETALKPGTDTNSTSIPEQGGG